MTEKSEGKPKRLSVKKQAVKTGGRRGKGGGKGKGRRRQKQRVRERVRRKKLLEKEGRLSSQRFKDNIKPMDRASEAILALKPATFHYKKEIDPDATQQFGLVAEDVAKINPDLVVRDAEGKVYTVRYDAVNAMLLNEFLKEHRKVEKLEAALTVVNDRLKEQEAKIENVSARIEMTEPAPKLVSNRRR